MRTDNHHYAEIFDEEFNLRAVTAQGQSSYELKRDIADTYNIVCTYVHRSVPLTKEVGDIITRVRKWDKYRTNPVQLFVLRRSLTKLLSEGGAIAEQWSHDSVDITNLILISRASLFRSATMSDLIAELVPSSKEMPETSTLQIYRNQALGLISTVLREGIARRAVDMRWKN